MILLLHFFVAVFSERPSVLLTPTSLSLIRYKVSSEVEPYKRWFDDVKNDAEDFIEEPMPTFEEFDGMASSSIRKYGGLLMTLCFVHLVTGEEEEIYFNHTLAWMDRISGFPDWNTNTNFGSMTILMGFSLSFDWCFHDHSNLTRRAIYVEKIRKQTQNMYDCIQTDCSPHFERYQSNHCYVEGTGFAIGGFALREEYPELSRNFSDLAYEHFTNVLEYINVDGVSPEGQSYWAYGLITMLMYFMAEKQFYGVDRVSIHDYFARTADYRLYTSVPGYLIDSPIYFGDVYGSSNDVYVMYRLSSKLQNGYLQWITEQTEPVVNRRADVSSLLWVDETGLVSQNPQNLPLYKWFDDIGILTVKSTWADDPSTIVTNFKANPPCGKRIEEQLGKNEGVGVCGHKHPDSGSFHIFTNGKLLVLDDGYTYFKRTVDHNCATFSGGIGQYGENDVWFDKTQYKDEEGDSRTILTKFEGSSFQYVVANLTRIYPLHIGLKKYIRHFVVVSKSKYVVVVDDIEFFTDQSPRTIDVHFHAPLEGSVEVRISSDDERDNIVFSGDDGRNFKVFDVSSSTSQHTITTGEHSNTVDPGHPFYSNIVNISSSGSRMREVFKSVVIPFTVNDTEPSIGATFSSDEEDVTIFTFDDGTKIKLDIHSFDVSLVSDQDIIEFDMGRRCVVNFLVFFVILLVLII